MKAQKEKSKIKVSKPLKDLKIKKLDKIPPKKLSKSVVKTPKSTKLEKPAKKAVTTVKKSKSEPKKTLILKKLDKKEKKSS